MMDKYIHPKKTNISENVMEEPASYSVHDTIVRKKLHGPKNAQYVHHDIQEDLLVILAKLVRNDILETLTKNKYFALLCDETKDCGKDEQLSVCIRYVAEGILYEEFYNFVRAEGLDAQSVMIKLKGVLASMGVDARTHLVAQCYDGASVMSGRLNGLQAIMRKYVCPKGIYVHCWAHRLNLVVVANVYDLDKASFFFNCLASIHSFFSATVPHSYFVHAQKELGEDKMIEGKALQQRELIALSKTRWCCQAEACDAVVTTLGSIVKSIEHFSDDENADRRFASQALVRIMDTDFVVCVVIFQHILRKASIAANYLQDKEIDVARAVNLISSLKDDLQRKEFFNDIWGIVKRLIERFGIQPPVERRRRRCRKDAALVRIMDTDFVVCVVIFQHILRKASIAANYLQDKEIDVARAVNLISSLKDDLQRKEFFNDIWGIVKRLIERFGIQPPVERRRRRCRKDANEIAWTMVDYKEKLFDVVIRSFVKELNRRFSSECYTI